MTRQGYQPGKGLGPKLQGTPHSIRPADNPGRQGLGFEEAADERRLRIRLERGGRGKTMWVPHINDTFPVASEIINQRIVGTTEEGTKEEMVGCIRKEELGERLTNWEANWIPVVSRK